MRMSVLGLLLFGFVAALSAAVLVVAFRAGTFGGREDLPAEVEVIVAAKELPAMSVIKADDVTSKKVARLGAPPGHLTNPVQVIGRVLSVAVTRDQAFTRNNFAADGTGIQLASALEEGMRAVSVSLSDYSSLYGLLYPGSVVDVLAYLKLPSEGGRQGEAISVTLLKGVQVLGVEDHTVVSTEKDADPKGPEGARPNNKRWMVTLMVKPRDAQALQLAAENGRISLAMRNPMDTKRTGERLSTSLTEIGRGRLSQLAAEFGLDDIFAGRRRTAGGMRAAGAPSGSIVAAASSEESASAAGHWDVEILRAGRSQVVSFPMTGKVCNSPLDVSAERSEQP